MHVSAHAYEAQSQYQVSFSVTPPLVRQGFSLCLECIDLAELTDQ